MRSEEEMLELILDTARRDARIRAVVMTGSRANPNAPRDIFQDFDIVYFVDDIAPFQDNFEWIERFGEIMILQMPETMEDPPPDKDGGFTYLMQFTDGNRIDLGIYPVENLGGYRRDNPSLVLMDKDGLFETMVPPGESGYLPGPPTAKAFADCCNEFWWVCPYVAKGLWRGEIPYARHMLDEVLREQLMKMLTWHIGARTGFSQDPGKHGKYFQKHFDQELWELFLRTYADAKYENTWEALFAMCELFTSVAKPVAERFGFTYPCGDEQRVRVHLEHVRRLPGDAKEMY